MTSTAYSIPALARGIGVLQHLAGGKPFTLEALSREMAIPKASLLRILRTLEGLNLVLRDPITKAYASAVTLTPNSAGGLSFDRQLAESLEGLACQTQQTAEWYVPMEAGMVLVRRAEPQRPEVGVLARVGFTRKWQEELDAVAMVGYAFFHPGQKHFSGFWSYARDGIVAKLSAAQARQRIAAAARGWAKDPFCNTNGVRRQAGVVFQQGRPVGVLAVAQHLIPSGKEQDNAYHKILLGLIEQLGPRPEGWSKET